MKKLILTAIFLLTLCLSTMAQDQSTTMKNITQDEALAIGQQVLIDKKVKPEEWFNDAASGAKFDDDFGLWRATFTGTCQVDDNAPKQLWGTSIFLSTTGELVDMAVIDLCNK